VLTLAMAALAAVASGYYHFVHYASRLGPFVPIFEKFDVNSLPNKTVSAYVSDQGPTQYATSDTFTGVLSQIRAALGVWDNVEASDIRLEYAGLFSPGTPQSAPAIQVVFEDLAPGVYGYTLTTARQIQTTSASGSFFAITGSVVVLPKDLSRRPSYGEGFFLTAVHELGHALGLQHTLTGSVMSTEHTRGVTRGAPLTADDVAGLTLLYPRSGVASNTGSISGRVLMSGAGVGMASVVAISPGGTAVSSLSNPDGTYRIDGIPPGQYFVYAHPLPPALPGYVTPADIWLPVDSNRQPFEAGVRFDTLFFPGSRDPQQVVPVQAGLGTENVNFFVQRRTASSIHTVATYSYPAQVAVKPGHLNKNAGRWMMVAGGSGLVVNSAPVAGLSVGVLGGLVSISSDAVRPYSQAPASYLQLDFQMSPFAPDGPGHLLFYANNDVYVLPYGFRVVQRQPPAILSVVPSTDAQGNRAAVIAGVNLGPDTSVLFDGVQAQIRNAEDGRLVVSPPPAPLGHRATVVAVNPDGQSNLFVQSTPPTYNYEPGDPLAMGGAFVSISPSSLPAGTDSMVEITGVGTNFLEGYTTVGFGTSDVSVRRLWVISPTRLLANVSVSVQMPPSLLTVTAASGLHYVVQPGAFQTQPGNQRQLTVSLPVLNAATGQRSLTPGLPAVFTVANLPAGLSASSLTVTVAGRPGQVLSVVGGQVTFQVPPGVPPGPAELRVQVGAEICPPVLVTIEPAQALIVSVTAGLTSIIDGNRPARPGELLTVMVMGAGDAPISRISVLVGSVEHQAVQVSQFGTGMQVQILLSAQVPVGTWPLVVTMDGRQSTAFALVVR
jgi:uncharacterized protein (TIGR03437 family)